MGSAAVIAGRGAHCAPTCLRFFAALRMTALRPERQFTGQHRLGAPAQASFLYSLPASKVAFRESTVYNLISVIKRVVIQEAGK